MIGTPSFLQFLLVIGIPMAVTLVANIVRRQMGAVSSSGGDLVLAALVADATYIISYETPEQLPLTAPEFRAVLVVVVLMGTVLFTVSARLQAINDELAHCTWANKNRPRNMKSQFRTTETFPRALSWGHFIFLQVYLVIHAMGILYLAKL